MKFCNTHEIAYEGSECPVCELKLELKKQESMINKLLGFRMSISNDKVLDVNLVSKVTGLAVKTIYHYNSTHDKDEKIPFTRRGRENVIKLSKLKQWAELNNKVLDLTQISIL